jgi:hypothetical protein
MTSRALPRWLPLRQLVEWNSNSTQFPDGPTKHILAELHSGQIIHFGLRVHDQVEEAVARRAGYTTVPSENWIPFDLDCDSILTMWRYAGEELPEEDYRSIAVPIQHFLDGLRYLDGPEPLDSAHYNFLLEADQNRQLAIAAYPWLLDALCDRFFYSDTYPLMPLLQAIDAGKELDRILAEILNTHSSAIRCLHTLPREIFAGFNRQPWLPHDASICTFLEFMAPIAQTVQHLPRAKLPKSLDQWWLLRDIVLLIQRIYGDPFQSRIAAKTYLRGVDASTLTEHWDEPDQGSLGNL